MRRALIIAMALLVATSCNTFIMKNDIVQLKELEKKHYVMLKDVSANNNSVKKGSEVKLKIATSKEWVKVYAYPAKVDELKADLTLILYLFDDDFEGKKFSTERFQERLNAIVAGR